MDANQKFTEARDAELSKQIDEIKEQREFAPYELDIYSFELGYKDGAQFAREHTRAEIIESEELKALLSAVYLSDFEEAVLNFERKVKSSE